MTDRRRERTFCAGVDATHGEETPP